MDEPCSALDPIATAKVEDLIHELKHQFTIVIVTHNMQQATRCSDRTAFFYLGQTHRIRRHPEDLYQSGRETNRRLHHRTIRLIFAAKMATNTLTMPNPHILSNFEEALRSLRNDALMMASLTERNLENTRKGLFDRDEDWCNTVIADDEEVDTLEVQVDREGVNIMMSVPPARLRHEKRHLHD